MEDLIKNFPWFSAPYIMATAAHKKQNSIYLEKAVRLAAAYAGSREILYFYLNPDKKPKEDSDFLDATQDVESQTQEEEAQEAFLEKNDEVIGDISFDSFPTSQYENQTEVAEFTEGNQQQGTNEEVIQESFDEEPNGLLADSIASISQDDEKEPETSENIESEINDEAETLVTEVAEEIKIEEPIAEVKEEEKVTEAIDGELKESSSVEEVEELPAGLILTKENPWSAILAEAPIEEIELEEEKIGGIVLYEEEKKNAILDIVENPTPSLPTKTEKELPKHRKTISEIMSEESGNTSLEYMPASAADYFSVFTPENKVSINADLEIEDDFIVSGIISKPKITNATIAEAEDFLQWLGKFSILENSYTVIHVPDDAVKIISKDRTLSQHKVSTKEATNIIDNFISAEAWKNRIAPAKFYTVEAMAQKSSEEDTSIATETLAQIYLEQELYNKAIEVYQRLCLKFPEKNTYFAALIEEIKKTKKE
ncbi:MAG: hypothetical protein NTX03_12255 [Bacteroidetes bacterium]|nr:hypothetical protein [Bacteroidota bacterium]